VAIYHPFTHLPDNYSLCHVVVEEMEQLLKHGFEAHFVVRDCFKDPVPEGVKVHAVLPFEGPVDILAESMPILKSMDFVFTHDIVYLEAYMDHDKALRVVAGKFPNIKWLHWTHSAPHPSEKRKPFPNSVYIGMNYTDLPRLAEQYQVPEADCRVVYNPVNLEKFFGWHPFTTTLVEKHNLLDCYVLIVYPLDTGRFEAKGGHWISKLVEKINKENRKAKVVFVNAAANDPERKKTILKYGFELTKNVIILNSDFPPMREFGEIDHVVYFGLGSTRTTTTVFDPSEDEYFEERAKIIIDEVWNSKALRFNRKVLNRFNPKWIWENQLGPLLR